MRNILAAILALVAGGCSLYPVPDDIAPPRTEDIARHVRCEVRQGIYEIIQKRLTESGVTEFSAINLQNRSDWRAFEEWLQKQIPKGKGAQDLTARQRLLLELYLDYQQYQSVAIGYDFDFNITETNNASVALGFKLPTVKSTFDLSTSASLAATRAGQRTFKAQETFAELVLNPMCNGVKPPGANIVYPLTGNIGLTRVIHTFMAISEHGGARDSFVDALAFTTVVSGTATASIQVKPINDAFRLVSASGTGSASRTDVHKLKVSLAFPQVKLGADVIEKQRTDGDSKASKDRGRAIEAWRKRLEQLGIGPDVIADRVTPYVISAVWRVRYNLCVADARVKEEEFKLLRHHAPEVYCLQYADAFAPRYVLESQLPRFLSTNLLPGYVKK